MGTVAQGFLAECLQAHIQWSPDFSAVYFIGAKLPPLWVPSQNGCFLLRPQEHHQ